MRRVLAAVLVAAYVSLSRAGAPEYVDGVPTALLEIAMKVRRGVRVVTGRGEGELLADLLAGHDIAPFPGSLRLSVWAPPSFGGIPSASPRRSGAAAGPPFQRSPSPSHALNPSSMLVLLCRCPRCDGRAPRSAPPLRVRRPQLRRRWAPGPVWQPALPPTTPSHLTLPI